MSDRKSVRSEFTAAAQHRGEGLIRETWLILIENKKWWLMPVFLALLILGALAVAGSTAAAPFIYTLF